MSWKVLNEEIDKFQARYVALKQIAEVVKRHPEWQKDAPELTELLHTVDAAKPIEQIDQLHDNCRRAATGDR